MSIINSLSTKRYSIVISNTQIYYLKQKRNILLDHCNTFYIAIMPNRIYK